MLEKTPVVLAFNQKYVIPALVTIKSVCENTSDKKGIEFYIFHKNLEYQVIFLIKEIVQSYGCIIRFMNMAGELDTYNKNCNVSDEIFYPLLIMKYFNHYKYVISLDADLLVRDDILKLIDMVPDHKKIGGVRCFFRNYTKFGDFFDLNAISKDTVGINNTKNYFNGGVLVFNMSAITDKERQDCLTLISKGWPSNEESILNHLFQSFQTLFPLEWNFQMELFHEEPKYFTEFMQSDFCTARENIKICHFMGYSKPWLNNVSDYFSEKYKEEWLRIAQNVMYDISFTAPRILCGPVWQKLKKIQMHGANLS